MPTKRPAHYIPSFQKILSLPPLLKTVRNHFKKIIEPTTKVKKPTISLPDILMSGLAIFNLKYPSLLQFDQKRNEPKIKANLSSLFGIKKSPCDTQMRERLDEIDPLTLRPAFIDIHKKLQTQHVLNEYHYLDDHLLFAIDGTTYYQSECISCEKCNIKNKKNGKIEYSHQALGCSIVHPEKSQVFSLFHEEIRKEDGDNKNDCEQNAVKRFLPEIRKVYPTQKITILEDSLFATAPHIKLLISLNFSYIIAAKPGDHAFLFKQFEQRISEGKTEEFEWTDKDGTIRGYRYCNDLPLNDSNQDVRVNFIKHWEVAATGQYKGMRKIFTFITDHKITKNMAADIAKGGRTRSKIENETFNTLKNQNYHFEHNYGHGKKHLSSVFVSLMFLAFLIDQIQEACCNVFQAAHKKSHSRIVLWERIRGLFLEFYINKWEDIYLSIIYGHRAGYLEPDIIDTS
jgi:hypothetical protein